ncbi:class I SAM-dependent methyltransferase [Nitrosarchaeum sp.]|uniref:class I SAM-dependent methyltransferase n=1 Tax=Nitrosarchaeum sp. TaxID=2026886 RepID=UPI00247ECD75|nr:class I SAM-dependent methyltransferase [Nitrosarchaeum sp.]MCV0411392.1 class I SAM-dependent methyltransferase [Nitrosarchaeum sp.]
MIKTTRSVNGYWPINHTFADRYVVTGITNLILEHVTNSKKKLIIIDVGCSKGVAMKYAQNYLEQKNIKSVTIGIDVSKNIVNDAKKNLNEFINKDVLHVDDCDEKADVVICSKAIIFVTGEIRYNIIKKCSKFLKNDGILITDVDCFEKSNLLDELRLFQYIIPSFSCFKNGLSRFYEEYRMRFYTPLRKKMKKKSKSDAINYAEAILSGWQSLSSLQKLDWKLVINWKLF